MNQVQEGLFELEEQMPCSPRAISLLRYALPATLDRAEQEEAAARILSFSQLLNQWVGVSWSRIYKMMREDYVTHQKAQLCQVEIEKVPFSGIFLFGPNHVVTGIQELLKEGLLRQVREGEGENAFDVFCPTPKLVSLIMQRQGIAA